MFETDKGIETTASKHSRNICGGRRTDNASMVSHTEPEPLLRTLCPALRELEKRLRPGSTRPPLSAQTLQRATLEGLAGDLDRQATALQMEQPLLVIMLMGFL